MFLDGEILTIPTHNDTLLYMMNGGAIVTIIGLTVWLIKTEIPRREVKEREEREKLRLEFSNLVQKMIDNFRLDIQLITKLFAEEMHLERNSHDQEMSDLRKSHSLEIAALSSSFRDSIVKLESRMAVIDIKGSRNDS